MAITKVIDAVSAAINLAGATSFSVTGLAAIDAVGFSSVDDVVIVNRLMSDGAYHPLTQKGEAVVLKAMNNAVTVEYGTYKLTRPVAGAAITAGYEEI